MCLLREVLSNFFVPSAAPSLLTEVDYCGETLCVSVLAALPISGQSGVACTHMRRKVMAF